MRRRTLLAAAGLAAPASIITGLNEALAQMPERPTGSPVPLGTRIARAHAHFDAGRHTQLLTALPGLLAEATGLKTDRTLHPGQFRTAERKARMHTDLARAWWQRRRSGRGGPVTSRGAPPTERKTIGARGERSKGGLRGRGIAPLFRPLTHVSTDTYICSMPTRSTNPLAGVVSATAAGGRLVFVPSRVREFGVTLGGSVMVPLWMATPLLLPMLVIAVLTESGLLWAIVWVGLGLTALAVIGLALALMFTVSATMVRWIEFRPQGDAKQLVIARSLRSSIVAAADLRSVVVVEGLRLGQRKSLKVVLHTRGGTVECEPGFQAPMSQVGAEALLAWLTSQLGSAGAAVEYRAKIDRNFACPGEWWTRSHLAALWHVPVGAVDELAARHGVRSYQHTTRAMAMHSPARTVTVYDPDRAYEVAEELRGEHATAPEAGAAQEDPRP